MNSSYGEKMQLSVVFASR